MKEVFGIMQLFLYLDFDSDHMTMHLCKFTEMYTRNSDFIVYKFKKVNNK